MTVKHIIFVQGDYLCRNTPTSGDTIICACRMCLEQSGFGHQEVANAATCDACILLYFNLQSD